MNDWQTWLAIGVCLAAAAYVGRRAWLALRGRKAAGCGAGCGSCPGGAAQQLRSIEPTTRPN